MAYTKTVWKDQDVENPRTYIARDNGDDTITLLDAFGTVTELGTPVNATNMNHIENGIEAVDNSAVHKTGDETITGNKTFTGSLTIPANTFVAKEESNTAEGGELYFEVGDTSPLLDLVKLDVYEGRMRIYGVASNGNVREVLNADIENNNLRAPASDVNDSVVTTLGIFRAPSESQDNYVKLGNGLLIQWGHVKQNTQQVSITFPLPFYDKGYRIFTQDAGQNSGYSYAGVTGVTRTTTGATLYSYYANRYYDWLAIGFWY